MLGLIAVLAAGACSNTASGSEATTTYYASGHRDAAPAVTNEPLLGGGTFDLAAERGHVVVMNFWGSWCGPCRAEAADLESTYKETGVVFVGVNVIDQQDSANAFVSAHGITYPSIFDPAGHVMLAFANIPPKEVPSTLVIDAAGKVASIHLAPVSSADLTAMIKAAQTS